jgi:broad specificity phosphatase PhoE
MNPSTNRPSQIDTSFLSLPRGSSSAVSTVWQDSNHLKDVTRFRNIYIAIRHGESEANLSKVASGCVTESSRYPLTPKGRQQIEEQIADVLRHAIAPAPEILYASDFLRAKQSAEIIASVTGLPFATSPALRERGAGEWEGATFPAEHRVAIRDYLKDLDFTDPGHRSHGLESPLAVLERTTRFVSDCEKQSLNSQAPRRIIWLIGHHDAIQILRAAFLGLPPGEAWNLPRLHNAGIVDLHATP